MKDSAKEKKPLLDRILDAIEVAGNKLPDPITLFLGLAFFVVIVSALCSSLGVTATNPANGKDITVFNLFTIAGIQYLWSNVISNFANFAPLTMVLVALVGASVAEKSGFLIAFMQHFLKGAKGWIVTLLTVFLGINLNLAGDAGFIILPPLAAVLYMSIGRHPILGLFVGYASVAVGFCANLLLGLNDSLAYGFTEPAARLINPAYAESIAINWYFLAVSSITLTITGVILVEKILIGRFPISKEQLEKYDFDSDAVTLTPAQVRGLRNAGIGFLIFVIVLVLMSVPIGDVVVLGDKTGSITSGISPFSRGIVFTASLALFIPGAVYGVSVGKYKNDKDVWADISKGFSEMGNYIFMCFFISIFTNFFAVSGLGTILAIKSADFLKNIGFTGIPLMIGLIILSSIVNLFIGSASAKWAILAPVFVPMMMLLGYDPAITQVIYRLGDSITNPLSPLFTYTPVILGYVRKYDTNAGLGTVIANMIPYSMAFAVVWIIQVIIWVSLDLPLGPGGRILLP